MSNMKEFLKSKKGLTFVALLLTLALGIAIGTIVSDGVFSAGQNNDIAKLRVQGEGSPLALEKEAGVLGFSKVAETVEPAVVNINTTAVIRREARQAPRGQGGQDLRDFFGDDFWERFFGGPMPSPRDQKITSLGSGVIVDSKGYILTNFHVVERADKINVTVQTGETYVAEVVGSDPDADVAVLKITAPKPLPFAKVGDDTKLKVGDWTLAIGNPFGVGLTVTSGIVSAIERVVPVLGANIFGDYIQTDAAINPGNSGGPLVNMRGEVVGLNTLIVTRSGGSQGVGFSIPAHVFVNSYNQIIEKGKVERGFLGVLMNDPTIAMTEEMAKFFGVAGTDPKGIKDGDGVIITEVTKGEPADKAGIRPEDVIVKFADKEVETSFDLRSAVASTPPGKSVPVVVVRKGQVLTLNVTLAERTLEQELREERRGMSFEERERERPKKEIGLEFQTLTPRDAERLGFEGEKGILITEVAAGSLADEAQMAPNALITHVNGEPVETGQEFKTKITSLPSGRGVVLRFVSVEQGPRGERQKRVAYTSFVKP